MTDQRYDQVFFGGKGNAKGKRQTTGKSFGRRQNPTGPDGTTMTCTICDSTDHFRAVCPRNQQSASSGSAGLVHSPNYLLTSEHTRVCPLADILFYNQVGTTTFSPEEPADLVVNHEPWPTPFHVPDLEPELPYASFLRAPAELANSDLQEPILAGAAYPQVGQSHELLETLTARANIIQSATEQTQARAPMRNLPQQGNRGVNLLNQFPAPQAFGIQRQQYQDQRQQWRQNNHRSQPMPDSRGPGIQNDASITFSASRTIRRGAARTCRRTAKCLNATLANRKTIGIPTEFNRRFRRP